MVTERMRPSSRRGPPATVRSRWLARSPVRRAGKGHRRRSRRNECPPGAILPEGNRSQNIPFLWAWEVRQGLRREGAGLSVLLRPIHGTAEYENFPGARRGRPNRSGFFDHPYLSLRRGGKSVFAHWRGKERTIPGNSVEVRQGRQPNPQENRYVITPDGSQDRPGGHRGRKLRHRQSVAPPESQSVRSLWRHLHVHGNDGFRGSEEIRIPVGGIRC